MTEKGASPAPILNPLDFEFMKGVLHQQAGLFLATDKAYLLPSRLMPLVRKWDFPCVEALIHTLRTESNGDLLQEVVEAMTTNETSFFRDRKPFEQLRSVVLPGLLRSRMKTKRLRIWSAGCAFGQEPYSVAMVLKEEEKKLQDWNVEIIASDISNEALKVAKQGIYNNFEIHRGLTDYQIDKFFTRKDNRWEIKTELKKKIRFMNFNLLNDPQKLGLFDVVLCRNVLIYFSSEIKRGVLERIHNVMRKDSILCVGGAETVFGHSQQFRLYEDRQGLYCPV